MTKIVSVSILTISLFSWASGQSTKPPNLPAKSTSTGSTTKTGSVKAPTTIDRGTVSGRTYANKTLNFEITFPDTWLMADDEFYAYMKSRGFDLSPKPPKAANPLAQSQLDAAFKRVTVLISAYRSMPGTPENTVARVAVEDIRNANTNRPIKDAVDYIDLLRSTLQLVKMPADFQYSETGAEKLGNHQFAYLDTASKEGKSRFYATIRGGYAILFTLNYFADEDLDTFRDTLARANFSLK